MLIQKIKKRMKKMAQIIDGKAISAQIRAEISAEVAGMERKPGLAVIIVGEDPASKIYVRNKKKACEEVGFYSEVYELPENTTQDELISLVHTLNDAHEIHGILVQLPLPKHIDPEAVILNISPLKDVDAFHPENVGRIMIGNPRFLPCTPAGVMELIRRSGIETEGKRCTVIGRSNIVGKPQAMLMLQANATVTICHSRTKNIAEITRSSDIIVCSVGKAHFLRGDMVSEGAVVIDVGMNHDENGKLCGDVEYAEVSEKASYITPVPGGVGPMTITMLLRNTLTAAKA